MAPPRPESASDIRGRGELPMSSLPIEGDTQNSAVDRSTPRSVVIDLEPIRTAIKGIRFGEVRIVIQNGIVIQIDRMEKQRLK